jgi:uncharacterized protein (DUF58 family)
MMAPSRALLWLVGLLFVPALTVVGLGGALARTGWFVAAATVSAAVIDVVLSLDRLAFVKVSLPSVVHGIVGRDVRVDAVVRGEDAPLALRLSLAFPPALAPRTRVVRLSRVAATGEKTTFHAKVLERGVHRAKALHFETSSRLGLWSIRRKDAIDVEIRAYPELLHDQKRLVAMLPRAQEGAFAARQVGRGRDFDRLREYVPGDPSDDIHWKATAKRRRPVTKLFKVERAQPVYVAVDASRLAARRVPSPGGDVALLERHIVAALLLGSAAERAGDLFGLASFSDDVHAFVRASRGRGHFRACREAAVTFAQRAVSPDFGQLFSFVADRVRTRSLVYVLTSLEDPAVAEEFAEGAARIGTRHLVVAASRVAPEVRPLFSGKPVESIDEVYDRLDGHLAWKRQRLLRRTLEQRGVRMIDVDHTNVVPVLVQSYLALKGRQAL